MFAAVCLNNGAGARILTRNTARDKRQRDQPTAPDAHPQQVQSQGVDSAHMVLPARGMPRKRHIRDTDERDHEDEKQSHKRAHPETGGGDHGGDHDSHTFFFARI